MLSCRNNFMIFSHMKVIAFPAETPETQGGVMERGKNNNSLNDRGKKCVQIKHRKQA